MLDAFKLTGKQAVITGGGSGIGREIAKTFAAAGATVRVLDLNLQAAQSAAQEAGNGATAIACDVSDPASVQQAFAEIDRQGSVDVLVNCAGVAHVGNLLNTEPDAFDRLFRVNVRGTYLPMQAAVERMVKQKRGAIVNLASIAATRALGDRFAYGMTKGAVLSMTLSVAKDYVHEGIRCNCISPARVHTPFVDGYVAKNFPGNEAEAYAKLAASAPIGRMGKPEEVALLALYLASDAAEFCTGCDYPIDGGFFNLK